jgi:hypothetical protein
MFCRLANRYIFLFLFLEECSMAQTLHPLWPPPPRPRASQGSSKTVKIVSIALILLLIVGGLSFVIYATVNQYGFALRSSRVLNTNATVQSEEKNLATLVSSLAQTAQPLATAQAQLIASATPQENPSATAASDQATATATVINTMLTHDTSGKPTLDDPLSDNTLHHQWDQGYTDNNATGCNFINSSYEVKEVRQGFLQPCFANATNFSNFVYQVTMTIKAGNQGGLIFRANKAKGQYYLFRMDIKGNYMLEVYNVSKPPYTRLLRGNNAAIATGTGVSNTLTVIANRSNLYLFVNKTYIDRVSDKTLSEGQIGVVAINTSLPVTADFTNAQVWKLA